MMSTQATEEIATAVQREIARKNQALQNACEKLLKLSFNQLPECCTNEEDGYEIGDETMPFFSETYLYNLLGKEDARTLLAMMRPIWSAAGIAPENQP